MRRRNGRDIISASASARVALYCLSVSGATTFAFAAMALMGKGGAGVFATLVLGVVATAFSAAFWRLWSKQAEPRA